MPTSNRNTAEMRILTLAEARALFSIYETMVETARTHNWEKLAEIERQAANLRDTAIARPFSHPAEVENLKELTVLITQIQRLDYEVRSLVEPAHEQARQQLAVEVKGRTVREAYGSMETPGG